MTTMIVVYSAGPCLSYKIIGNFNCDSNNVVYIFSRVEDFPVQSVSVWDVSVLTFRCTDLSVHKLFRSGLFAARTFRWTANQNYEFFLVLSKRNKHYFS